MLRNIGIRSKILAVLALPVLVLLLAAGIISGGAVSDARRAGQVEILAGQAGDLTQLVRGLQAERALSVAVLSGDAGARPALDEVRGRIDVGLAQVRDAVGGVDLDQIDPSVAEAVASSQAAHDQIASLRTQVDQQALSASAAQIAFTAVIAEDIALPGRIGDAVEDRDLSTYLRAYTSLERLAESITAERDLGAAAVAAGAYSPEVRAEMTTVTTRQQVLREDATAAAAQVGARVPALGYSLQLARQKSIDDPDGVIDRIGVDDWRTIVDGEVAALDSTLERLAAGGSAQAASLSENARSQAVLVVVLAVAAVVVPVMLALLLARRITRPLRRLTEAAAQVRDHLPQMVERMQTPGEGPGIEITQIPVDSGDEVGRLAAAFNEVNATTVQVAQDQAALRGSIAAMFVNVARRDQVLLSRQLAFIDQLERTEENPATLDNLFRLDHLATRMRRNAESLLVLAGIDTGRRLRRPMPLSDVIRTASSEIEHYERIDLALRVDPPVVGHVALTTAHLLAELLENATNFSDPESRVVVSTGTGPRGIVVTIVDDGLGMTPQEIVDANTRIADPPASEVVGSQRLGFFVVGRLARKLDASVSLRSGRARGTVVTIELAPALFTPGSVIELPVVELPVVEPPVVEVPAQDANAVADADPAVLRKQAADVPAAREPQPREPDRPRVLDAPPADGGLPRRGAPGTPRTSPPRPRSAESLLDGVARPDSGEPTVPSAGPGSDVSDPPLPRRGGARPAAPADSAVPVNSAAPVDPAPVEPLGVDSVLDRLSEQDGQLAGDESTGAARDADGPAADPPSPARTGGLFSGFRARHARPEPTPNGSTESAAEPERTLDPVALESARVVEPELVVEPEPVVVEPVLVVEPEHVVEPEPVVVPERVVEPAPAPTVGAAALDILPGRAAARAARNRGNRGFRFGRSSSSRTGAGATSGAPAPAEQTPVPVGVAPAPVSSATLRPAPVGQEPVGQEPVSAAASFPAPADQGFPFVPEHVHTEDTAAAGSAPPPATLPGRTAVQPAPPSLFGTPVAPPVFGAQARPAASAPAEPTGPAPSAPLTSSGVRGEQDPATAVPEHQLPVPDAPTSAAPTFVAEPAFGTVTDTAATAPAPVPQPIGDVLRQRSALASEALTELSRLSTYRPAVEPQAPVALARRTPASTPAAVLPTSRPPAGAGRRSRTASDVRSMLSGFQAGAERGRSSPAHPGTDHSPAEQSP